MPQRAGLLRWMSHHLRGLLIAHLYLAYVRSTMEYASRVPLAWLHGAMPDGPCLAIREQDTLRLERTQAAAAHRIMPHGTLAKS